MPQRAYKRKPAMTNFTQDQNNQNNQNNQNQQAQSQDTNQGGQGVSPVSSGDDSYVNSYAPPVATITSPPQDPGFKTYDKSKTNSPSPQYLKDIVANSPENAANALMPEDMDKDADMVKDTDIMVNAMKSSTSALDPIVSAPLTPPPVVTPPAMDKPMEDRPADNSTNSKTPSNESQDLEEQNIFDLLGVSDGSDEDKEAFLDELQQVIWEDFLENDVPLLVTLDEKKKVDEISAKTDQSDLDKQEELVVYLEKLIPDLEEIMLEKALELKEDMVRERVNGMREYYADNQEKLDKITEAEGLVAKDQWSSAAKVLNAIPK